MSDAEEKSERRLKILYGQNPHFSSSTRKKKKVIEIIIHRRRREFTAMQCVFASEISWIKRNIFIKLKIDLSCSLLTLFLSTSTSSLSVDEAYVACSFNRSYRFNRWFFFCILYIFIVHLMTNNKIDESEIFLFGELRSSSKQLT